jgi:FlgN protein
MSSILNNPLPPPAAERLARLCLEQVAHEQAHIAATLAGLRDVRAALLGQDQTALGAALARHETTARGGDELGLRRAAFQKEAGELLDVSAASVTLDLLAAHLPADAAGPIAEARARLRQQAIEVERLSSSNASLLYYCLDFLQRFFDRLTDRPRDGRYGPAGKVAPTSGGSLINARG